MKESEEEEGKRVCGDSGECLCKKHWIKETNRDNV